MKKPESSKKRINRSDVMSSSSVRSLIRAKDKPAKDGHHAAHQYEKTEKFEEEVEKGMILVGLVAMKDPPRPEVKDAVSVAKQAGIKIVIITGDYGPTAEAIAKEVDIVSPKGSRIITGINLENMSDKDISDEVRQEEVIFSRVSGRRRTLA
jgi:magnesium-transporting ATPase (P-type)